MKKIKNEVAVSTRKIDSTFFSRFWEKSWVYIKTVVDVVSEPVLILDKDLHVIAANKSFYDTFSVKEKETVGQVIYKLGNGQWNILELRKLLETILPKHTFFKGFQVAHEFPSIGRKVMILNGRQIHVESEKDLGPFPSVIVLAIEDVTDMMVVADSLANHAKNIEAKISLRAQKMELHIGKLEDEIKKLKKKKVSKK